jgi:hypothetical protein
MAIQVGRSRPNDRTAPRSNRGTANRGLPKELSSWKKPGMHASGNQLYCSHVPAFNPAARDLTMNEEKA